MIEMLCSWQFWVVAVIIFILGIWLGTVATGRSKDEDAERHKKHKKREQIRRSVSRLSTTSNCREATVRDDVELSATVDYTPVLHERFSMSTVDYTPELPEVITNPDKRADSKRKPSEPRSKGEVACKEAIEEICAPYKFHSTWPAWLINPDTKKGLELDLYNEELGIAVEFNGQQHYKYTPHFHKKGMSDFRSQVRRDNHKIDLCDENSVWLITVPYNVPIPKIKDYINYYMPENVERRNRRRE